MHRYASRRLTGLIAVLALFAILAPATPHAQVIAQGQTIELVRQKLDRLSSYGVFDYLEFTLERGVVTLAGYANQTSLRGDAERAAKRLPGVDEVGNRIEQLPLSPNDDRIRWTTFYNIYTDDSLSRYSPGGAIGAWVALAESRRFPGMQPFGSYPIHIVVKNGRTILVGMVGSEFDRRIAELRAREVIGVFEVDNRLVVESD